MNATKRVQRSAGRTAMHIIEQPANHSKSQHIAESNGGRLATVPEIIRAFKDAAFYNKIEEKWFWLGDESELNVYGCCKIDYEKGTITPVSEIQYDELPKEQKLFVFKGKGQLSMFVRAAAAEYGRFGLHADISPEEDAPLVVFIKNEPLKELARKSE